MLMTSFLPTLLIQSMLDSDKDQMNAANKKHVRRMVKIHRIRHHGVHDARLKEARIDEQRRVGNTVYWRR